MEYYVGLDVSLKQTSICVVDQSGSVVREGVVNSDPEVISVYVRSKAPGAVRIGLETGPTSTWLWTELIGKLALTDVPAVCRRSHRHRAWEKWAVHPRPPSQAVAATGHPSRPLSRAMRRRFLMWNSIADDVAHDTLKTSQVH